MYHNIRYKRRKIEIYRRELGREDGGGCAAFTFLVLRFSVCCYKDKERERFCVREKREERIHSLTQSSGTLLEVIAKWVYKFKILSSH